jgi:FHS family glucose/mannose:H+ symporter-like MFS transporter
MQKMSSRLTWLITAAAFYAFFVFGFSDNLKGPTLPALLQDLHLNYSLGGTILFGAYGGFLVATLLTGLLSELAGKRAVLLMAGVCLTIGIFGYSSSSTVVPLTASMVALGLGLGSIELGANSLIVELHSKRRGLLLNLLAVFHGAGSMVAPLYAGWLLNQGVPWRDVYRWAWVAVGILIAAFLILPYRRPAPDPSKPRPRLDFSVLRRRAFTTEMAWFYLAIGVYTALELGVASWIVEFLQKARGQSVTTSTASLSLFFAMITLGRLLGSFVVERVGYLRTILIASLGAALFAALGIFAPPGLSILLPLSGIFLSIIFPTLTAEVSSRHADNTGAVLGLLFTFAGVGGMLGPWLVGIASDLLGIHLGLGLNALLYCMVLAASVLVLMRRARRVAG